MSNATNPIDEREIIELALQSGETPEQIAEELGFDYDSAEDAVLLTGYVADDGNCAAEYNADSAADAAQDYVDDGDWNAIERTTWINVRVWRVGLTIEGEVRCEESSHKIAIEPIEPQCAHAVLHQWSDSADLGAAVHGHGGGVVVTEICAYCGCARVTDTWATDPEDGTQGHTAVYYVADEADSETLARHWHGRSDSELADAVASDGLDLDTDRDDAREVDGVGYVTVSEGRLRWWLTDEDVADDVGSEVGYGSLADALEAARKIAAELDERE